VRVITPADPGLPYSLSSRLAGMILPRNKRGKAMTELNNEVCELSIDEMTGEELDTVTGGSMINISGAANAARNALFDAKFAALHLHIATELF
jgi:hypothetical protein